MPSPGDQNSRNHGIDWPAVVRTLFVQVLVLLALAGAFVGYINWSSEVAWTEFIAASKASEPVQTVNGHTLCHRKG